MTLAEIQKQSLALIEELNVSLSGFTSDTDISNKLNYVINLIQYELARVKKIPAYKELTVETNEIVNFSDIDDEYDIYQLSIVRGVEHEFKAEGTVIKALEDGKLEIEYFRYPKKIDSTTANTTVLDLSPDVLECMPYGVASDVLKSDVSNNYGNVYAQRYAELKNQIDIRYNTGSIRIEGGFSD